MLLIVFDVDCLMINDYDTVLFDSMVTPTSHEQVVLLCVWLVADDSLLKFEITKT